MLLYQLPYSHFSSKIKIILLEKQIAVDFPDIPGAAQSSDQYHAINPTGLVPCLVDGDFVLSESEVIAEYLNDHTPEPAMLPVGVKERARSRWLSRIHDLYIAPTLSAIFGLTLAESIDTEVAEEKLESLFKYLDMVEDQINPSPYFFGEQFGISDASYCLSFWYALGLTAQLGSEVPAARYPKLFSWFDAACKRDSFKHVLHECQCALGMDTGEAKSA